MKKKLEAELISIAHRILQLKHKEDIRELHHEAQKLYEKLSVLLFVEEHFSEAKPTIGLHDMEIAVEKAFDFDEKIPETRTKDEEIIIHDINEEIPPAIVAEEIKKVVEEPKITIEESPIIEIPKLEKKQVSIDDFLSNMQPEPIFERVSNVKKTEDSLIPAEISKIIEDKIVPEVKIETEIFFDKIDTKPATNLNDKLNKSVK